MKRPDYINVTVPMSPELRDKLKLISGQRDVSMAKWVRDSINRAKVKE